MSEVKGYTVIGCQLCDQRISLLTKPACDHSKNGYCAVFLLQAKEDAITYNMHPSIHTKAKEEL